MKKLALLFILLPFFLSAQDQVDWGTEYTVTATPNEGWEFLNWTENGEVVSTNPVYTFTVTADRNLVANFQRLNFIIQVEVNPAGAGQVEGSGIAPSGDEVRLHAIPHESYNFENFTELLTGDVIKENPYVFVADRDRYMEANFIPKGEGMSGWILLALTALAIIMIFLRKFT